MLRARACPPSRIERETAEARVCCQRSGERAINGEAQDHGRITLAQNLKIKLKNEALVTNSNSALPTLFILIPALESV